MTMALCLNCGKTKFGAICPCSECGVSSTGNIELDIQFSDHFMALSTLEQLGATLREIKKHSPDEELCFLTFIYVVSQSESPPLSFTPPEEMQERIDALLAQCTLPKVEWKPGYRSPLEENTASPKQRRWWQFWKRGP